MIGRSKLVGRPVAQLLLRADCTVTIAHSRTRDLPALCRQADILVVAIGKPEFVRGDWIKPGAAVIDVGINRVPAADGKTRLVGDVAFDEALPVAGHLTPVPGGVGPMTVACLMFNTLQKPPAAPRDWLSRPRDRGDPSSPSPVIGGGAPSDGARGGRRRDGSDSDVGSEN